MIILKANLSEFVVLGSGVHVKAMDEEIWATVHDGPVKLGEYDSPETAKAVLKGIIDNYTVGIKLYIMP